MTTRPSNKTVINYNITINHSVVISENISCWSQLNSKISLWSTHYRTTHTNGKKSDIVDLSIGPYVHFVAIYLHHLISSFAPVIFTMAPVNIQQIHVVLGQLA